MGNLTRDERRAARIKEIVEDTVDAGYYPELMNTATSKDPIVREFFKIWREQEIGHAHALKATREATTPPGDELRVHSIPYVPTHQRWYRLIGDDVTKALHMTWGTINETVTHFVYKILAQKTENRTFRELLRAILYEETNHMAFYNDMARWFLHHSKLARILVPRIIRYKWKGVGADVVSDADTRFLSRYVMQGKEEMFTRHAGDFVRELPGMSRFAGDRFLIGQAGLG